MQSPAENLPFWAAAIADRITFHANLHTANLHTANLHTGGAAVSSALAPILATLRQRVAASGNDTQILHGFLENCLALLLQAATTQPELAPIRADLAALCALARTALAQDQDDRPILHRAAPLANLPGTPGFAARIPERVVWLAAMAATMPDETAAAAASLADDLATISTDLPLQALRAALASDCSQP